MMHMEVVIRIRESIHRPSFVVRAVALELCHVISRANSLQNPEELNPTRDVFLTSCSANFWTDMSLQLNDRTLVRLIQ